VTSPDGRYAYLGPAGTFTEAALLACLGELGLAGSAELVVQFGDVLRNVFGN